MEFNQTNSNAGAVSETILSRLDNDDPITAAWLSSIRVYPADNDGSERSKEHEVRIDAGNAVGRTTIYGDEPGESVYLGISLSDGLCYVEACDNCSGRYGPGIQKHKVDDEWRHEADAD